jgi:hypothetical protein
VRCPPRLHDREHQREVIEEAEELGHSRHIAVWVFRWDDTGGHVRGVDVIRVRDGKVAEKLAYVKG